MLMYLISLRLENCLLTHCNMIHAEKKNAQNGRPCDGSSSIMPVDENLRCYKYLSNLILIDG